MKRFKSVLIANRGEIVVRVARSARRLGLHTIAIASDPDRTAPHTRSCDRFVAIGGEHAADSYLNIERILHAARSSGADAVHPGYGFLSENPAFARAVIDAGLVWIGPPPEAMEAMGNKALARKHMSSIGIPVLRGYDGEAQDLNTLTREAQRVGFPVMVKAAAGGGGRGMRLVKQPHALEAAVQAARSEAQAAFGDGRLLLERALPTPRHVELQIFADLHGHVLHLGERDCSVQRRHQKIVEEAPSPAINPALRRHMGEAAIQVAQAVGYVGAGTVEFLLEDDDSFWFMEMNTRLQVEHPVTEALTGIDLVEWQLKVAMGEPLPWRQDELLKRYESAGHAIEVRLCAENPAEDFLPCAGTIRRWQPPEGIRCDHAVANGYTVSPLYDSMLAKLIAHGLHRDATADLLANALDSTLCLGLTTNRAFLAETLRHAAFRDGPVTTGFVATHFPQTHLRGVEAASWLEAMAAAALALLPTQRLPPMWAGWCPCGVIDTTVVMRCGTVQRRWQLYGTPTEVTARCDDALHKICGLTQSTAEQIHAIVDDHPRTAMVVRHHNTSWWQSNELELTLEDLRLAPPMATAQSKDATQVTAPMHGRVVQVLVEPGCHVKAGALLMVMEAMKMEHRLTAPSSGTVQAVHARVGEQVPGRKLLLELGV